MGENLEIDLVTRLFNCAIFNAIFFYRGTLCSGGAVNHYISGLMASMLHENIEEKYLDKIIKIYRVRYIMNIFTFRKLYYHLKY